MRAVINLTSKIESIEELHSRQMMEYEDLDKKMTLKSVFTNIHYFRFTSFHLNKNIGFCMDVFYAKNSGFTMIMLMFSIHNIIGHEQINSELHMSVMFIALFTSLCLVLVVYLAFCPTRPNTTPASTEITKI